MSAHTVMTHALIQGEESADVQSLRVALANATDARRAAEDAARDMGYTMPDLCEDVRNAVRAETAAYLALFDARHAPSPSPVGVSLAKASDAPSVAALCADVLRGCAHTAVMDESGAQVACGPVPVRSAWMLRANDLDSLADWFALGRA